MAAFNNLNEERDAMVCTEEGWIFSVSSASKSLNFSSHKGENCPWKMIWKTKIKYKVNCFTWLLTREAVLTHEDLNKEDSLCAQDPLYVESKVRQATISFYIASGQISYGECSSLKISWVKPGSIRGILSSWKSDSNATTKEEIWKIVPSCIWWTTKSRELFAFDAALVSNYPKKIYWFWRIRHTPVDIFEESSNIGGKYACK